MGRWSEGRLQIARLLSGHRSREAADPFPDPPQGGMTYANWSFGLEGLFQIETSFHLDNDPGPTSDLYLQLYDAPIDGTATYHGVQTTNLVIFSRFGTTDLNEVRPAPGARAVAGTDEGPFVSLRLPFPLGAGSFRTRLRRAERGRGDGDEENQDGDWFELSIERTDGGPTDRTSTSGTGGGGTRADDAPSVGEVGAIRFPRANRRVPATMADGGGTWTEFWDNNGPVLYPVPLWQIRVDPPLANGTTRARGVTLRYSQMPNGLIDWDRRVGEAGQVVTTIGGSTMRRTDNSEDPVRFVRFPPRGPGA